MKNETKLNELDLYIDNHFRARTWLIENLPNRFAVYRDNITVNCNDKEEKNNLSKLLVKREGDVCDRKLIGE